jgi:hypothetical protein
VDQVVVVVDQTAELNVHHKALLGKEMRPGSLMETCHIPVLVAVGQGLSGFPQLVLPQEMAALELHPQYQVR